MKKTALRVVMLLLLVAGCRKPPPAEVVFTGKTGQPNTIDASIVTGDAGFSEETFTRAALLRTLADCARDRATAFESAAQRLADATAAAASTSSVAAAREAWRAAIDTWEENELFRFGPAASSMAPGGQNLRDQIYAWPLVSRCKIEEQIVSRAYESPDFAASLINGRGLSAIEYLLFYEGTDNDCSEFSAINADGTWGALSEAELRARKYAYAAAAARDVLARARALSAGWQDGAFYGAFVNAGKGSGLFDSEQRALNAASDGLFYLDKEIKDAKLARPLGYVECNQSVCPEAVESPWAHRSNENLRANLIGFRRIFNGCSEADLGYDDWLREAGAGDLSARMTSALNAAIDRVERLGAPLEQIVLSDVTPAEELYATIKALNDVLKTEFVTVLNLELPRIVEGDND